MLANIFINEKISDQANQINLMLFRRYTFNLHLWIKK